MGRHILYKGKEVISAILKLGESLGYVVNEEFPLEKRPGNPPAVDAAWLSDEDHDFPLMIFEIESKITGSIANNPVKVFGQPNEHFEKPLFFFHVFLDAKKDSSKIGNLQSLFGLYNYRTYSITEKNEVTRFLIDILSQHRRLYRKLDLESLIKTLDHRAWESAGVEEILKAIESQRFAASYLRTYAMFSLDNPDFIKHYLRFLELFIHSHPKKAIPQEYGTYWGDMWADPIHYGILISAFPDNAAQYLELLRNWQEKSSYLTMIGPHFGLSRDYDEFILCLAPPFWAFLASLMAKYLDAVEYIASQCGIILGKLEQFPPRISFFTALWLLHIACAASSDKHYELARSFINDRGGISETFLYNPPDTIPLEKEDKSESDRMWRRELQNRPVKVPNMRQYSSNLKTELEKSYSEPEEVLHFAFRVLLDPGIHANWTSRIRGMLTS